jgi:CheY-like chemotaxis protein
MSLRLPSAVVRRRSRALKSGHFDCIVLDLGLPDMTGFELIEQIKQEVRLSNLPVIVIPGKS